MARWASLQRVTGAGAPSLAVFARVGGLTLILAPAWNLRSYPSPSKGAGFDSAYLSGPQNARMMALGSSMGLRRTSKSDQLIYYYVIYFINIY